MAITFRITDAGWAAWQTAQGNGTNAVTIAEVGFGNDGHAIDDTATALVSEQARVGAAGGQNIGPQRIHITAVEGSEQDYTIREIGLFLSDGTLFAQWSDGTETAGNKVAAIPYVLTVDIGFDDLPDGSVVIDQTDISFPPATETIAGRIEIATQAEVNAGVDDQRAVTPAKLAGLAATLSTRGMIELASGTETQAGSDNTRAVTPLALASLTASASRRGLIEIATQAEVNAGNDDQRAVTPKTMSAALVLASESAPGRIEIATLAEVDAGSDDARAVTPLKLATVLNGLVIDTVRLADEAVTLPKIQHINENTLLGRDNAGTGDVQALTAAEARALLNVEDGATADQTASEIKTLYESNADTNALTNAFRTILEFLTVTAATDLDAIRTRVAELDAAVVLQGEWDASTGTFPGGGSAQPGHSWIVNTDGTVDGVDFVAGDRVVALVADAPTGVYAGNWLKADYTDRVASVFGRVGPVTAQSGDYTAEQIAETSSAKILTAAERTAIAAAVQASRAIAAGTGLTGGGDLSSDRTISLNQATIDALARSLAIISAATDTSAFPSPGETTSHLAALIACTKAKATGDHNVVIGAWCEQSFNTVVCDALAAVIAGAHIASDGGVISALGGNGAVGHFIGASDARDGGEIKTYRGIGTAIIGARAIGNWAELQNQGDGSIVAGAYLQDDSTIDCDAGGSAIIGVRLWGDTGAVPLIRSGGSGALIGGATARFAGTIRIDADGGAVVGAWAQDADTRIQVDGAGSAVLGSYAASGGVIEGDSQALGVLGCYSSGALLGPDSSVNRACAALACDVSENSGEDLLKLNNRQSAAIACSTGKTSARGALVGSQATEMVTNNSLTMGFANGAISSANRTIELQANGGGILISGAVTPGHAFSDIARLFEHAEGAEIPPGMLLTRTGTLVRPAGPGEPVVGVVSHKYALLTNESSFCWQGRYLRDEWGRPIYEDIPDPDWASHIPDPDWAPGPDETEADRPLIANPEPQGTVTVEAENPDYDPGLDQIPRIQRPAEWTPVGILGEVLARVDDTVAPDDAIAAGGDGIGTRVAGPTNLVCMEITQPYDAQLGYAIASALISGPATG